MRSWRETKRDRESEIEEDGPLKAKMQKSRRDGQANRNMRGRLVDDDDERRTTQEEKNEGGETEGAAE